jgi:acyl-CoA synthetase (NDP forming)
MTPRQLANLRRLLQPRHVAVIGGETAAVVIAQCRRIGFAGPIWPVNPKRRAIGDLPCFARVTDLPQAPDAVYLAIPREPAIDTLSELAAMGAGGVVCYAAGFSEIGNDGALAEHRLCAAAGDLALLGPNCYGIINYLDRVALWPFAHGGSCPGFGAAIITQSGMLSSDITMSQRSLPFACMVSAGNQSMLRVEDFLDLLSEREEVRAFGLHLEGLKDVAQFEAVALKVLKRNRPIVVLKTGTSALGAALTVSHTASLSGTQALYEALFDRLGIITVTSPVQLLETLKFISVTGIPRGRRIAGLTCSGGGATMLADHAEKIGLAFPKPSDQTAAILRRQLPATASVSNPLDYTTPIWGVAERTGPVFDALLADPYDAAVIVQDYPAAGLDESKPFYASDTNSFIAAAKTHNLPAAVCSTLPENLDVETRDRLVARQVAPMQGLPECLNALAGCAWYHERRLTILAGPGVRPPLPKVDAGAARTLDEAAAKAILVGFGLPVPRGRIARQAEAPDVAAELGFPVALKMISARLPHKTEAGAVRLGLADRAAVAAALEPMRQAVLAYDPEAASEQFLVEHMVGAPIAELLVGVRRDPDFGYAMTLASGGVLVELVNDAVTILLPATRAELDGALRRLRFSRLIDGYRGQPGADRGAILDGLERLAAHLAASGITEVEINPLFALANGIAAVDVVMRVAPLSASA